ncbi:MAPEG family protein [Bowmanella yangjiangensis]|uniref:MAPEG family protein n=1 Tax=Bowmanella yangjiangensis TaxID=2811230 RepID=A0ABS3CNL5_9ALTE|nr:MAPEG family protein [Bowmanella yangjiangensis]MBN7818295.1 MAPEG family protein [Bowmanella yangjiangensis]
MYTVLLCLLIASLLPLLAKAPLAIAQAKAGGYDNRHPRNQQSALTGFGARAKAAHENAFEALIMFTPGALAVLITGQADSYAQYLAMTFIAARLCYNLFYLLDWHLARSSVWTVGVGCSVALTWHALQAV